MSQASSGDHVDTTEHQIRFIKRHASVLHGKGLSSRVAARLSSSFLYKANCKSNAPNTHPFQSSPFVGIAETGVIRRATSDSAIHMQRLWGNRQASNFIGEGTGTSAIQMEDPLEDAVGIDAQANHNASAESFPSEEALSAAKAASGGQSDTSDKGRLGDEHRVAASASAAVAASALLVSSHLDDIWQKDLGKVDLPEYVQANATTITFPEKLMLMLIHAERTTVTSGRRSDDAAIAWALGGRAFVIRDRERVVQKWLPMFFRHGKFQSFTRKLYRWGFRQVNLPREVSQESNRELVFASPHFQRDRKDLMAHMKSVTAAGLRRQQQQEQEQARESEETKRGVFKVAELVSGPSFGFNAASALLPQQRLMGLPSLSSLPDDAQSHQAFALLDPLTRQLLLSQQRSQIGLVPLSFNFPSQQQQQLLMPVMPVMPHLASRGASLSRHSAIQQPAINPLLSLLDPSNSISDAAVQGLRRASGAEALAQGLRRASSADAAVQDRLRALAEQFLRGQFQGGPPPR